MMTGQGQIRFIGALKEQVVPLFLAGGVTKESRGLVSSLDVYTVPLDSSALVVLHSG